MGHSKVLAELGKAACAPSWISESNRTGSVPTPSTRVSSPSIFISAVSVDSPSVPSSVRISLSGHPQLRERRTPSLGLGLPRSARTVSTWILPAARTVQANKAEGSHFPVHRAAQSGDRARGQSPGTSPRFSPRPSPDPRPGHLVRCSRAPGRCPGAAGSHPPRLGRSGQRSGLGTSVGPRSTHRYCTAGSDGRPGTRLRGAPVRCLVPAAASERLPLSPSGHRPRGGAGAGRWWGGRCPTRTRGPRGGVGRGL